MKKFFIENYSKSFKYIRESRNFIYSALIIFFVFSIIGFFVPPPEIIEQQILTFIQELLERTSGMGLSELTGFIFLNNIKSSFMGIILGFFLGLFPLFAIISNGYLLGFVSSVSVDVMGIFILWRLLPHGIFELSAIFISLGLGLKFGTFIFQKDKSESFRKYLWDSLRVFLFIVIPLLAIGAIIEGILISIF